MTTLSIHRYYNSKGLLSDGDSREAIDGFKEVVKMEDDKGEWGFKAHKQMVRGLAPRWHNRGGTLAGSVTHAFVAAPPQVKLHFKNKDYKEMMVVYKSMLSYIKCASPESHATGSPQLRARRAAHRGYYNSIWRSAGAPHEAPGAPWAPKKRRS